MIKAQRPLWEHRWSSYPEYLKAPRKRPAWLRVDRLLGEMGIPKDSAAGRRAFEQMMEQRRQLEQSEEPEGNRRIRRGWYLGDKEFQKELLGKMSEQRGESHYGQELRESEEEKAEGIVCQELKRLRWNETDLENRLKGDRQKLLLAMTLRRQTTISLKWVARRLHTRLLRP